MTWLTTTPATAGADYYALLSAEAKFAKSQRVASAPPPGNSASWSFRTIEVREKPFERALRRLEDFAALPVDWDSYGACPVTDSAVATARAILEGLALRPAAFAATNLVPFNVAPISTGGVHLEWRRNDTRSALELWIAADGGIGLLIDRPSLAPRFHEAEISAAALAIGEVLAFAA